MKIRLIQTPQFRCEDLGIEQYRKEGRIWFCDIDYVARKSRAASDTDKELAPISVYIEFESDADIERFEQEVSLDEATVTMPDSKQENRSGVLRIALSGMTSAAVFGYDCDCSQDELLEWGKDVEARWRVAFESSVLSAKELRERVRTAIKKLGFGRHVFVDEYCVAESLGSPHARGHKTVIFQVSDCGFCFSDMHFKDCARAIGKHERFRQELRRGFYDTPSTPI
jgi:hypothetical protein